MVDAIEDGTDVVDDEAAVVEVGAAVEDEIVADDTVVDAAPDLEPRWDPPAHPAETMPTARTATQFDSGREVSGFVFVLVTDDPQRILIDIWLGAA